MAPVRFDGSIAGVSSLLAVLLIFTIGTTIFRFIARNQQKSGLRIDDWLTIPPPLCIIGLTVLGIYGMTNGFMGVAAPSNPAFRAPVSMTERVYFPTDCLTVIALGCIRLSALFFYRRIFCVERATMFSIASLVMIVIVTLWTVGYFITTFLICDGSVDAIYAGSLKCHWVAYLVGLGFSSFILDVIVILLPIPMIWSLHTTTGRRLSITAVFLLAFAGLGASCARMVIFVYLWKHWGGVPLDPYISNTVSFYYQVLEVGLGSIAVNLPSLWYLIRGVKPGNVLQSFRSMISLRSTSKVSHQSLTQQKSQNSEKNLSPITITQESSVEFTAADDHDDDNSAPTRRERLEKYSATKNTSTPTGTLNGRS